MQNKFGCSRGFFHALNLKLLMLESQIISFFDSYFNKEQMVFMCYQIITEGPCLTRLLVLGKICISQNSQ